MWTTLYTVGEWNIQQYIIFSKVVVCVCVCVCMCVCVCVWCCVLWKPCISKKFTFHEFKRLDPRGFLNSFYTVFPEPIKEDLLKNYNSKCRKWTQRSHSFRCFPFYCVFCWFNVSLKTVIQFQLRVVWSIAPLVWHRHYKTVIYFCVQNVDLCRRSSSLLLCNTSGS